MENAPKSPTEIAQNLMLNHDAFSQWLGIEIVAITQESCTIKMTVSLQMTNGFGVAHGGITYSFADSAFAFACNALGIKSVSIETAISHLRPVFAHDVLTAHAVQNYAGNKTSVFTVEIHNQKAELVALFKGTAYRTGKAW